MYITHVLVIPLFRKSNKIHLKQDEKSRRQILFCKINRLFDYVVLFEGSASKYLPVIHMKRGSP